METVKLKNVIKRNAISIKGNSIIKTSGGEIGDEIHATRKIGGWIMLNCRTGKYYQCWEDYLRNFIIITEMITI